MKTEHGIRSKHLEDAMDIYTLAFESKYLYFLENRERMKRMIRPSFNPSPAITVISEELLAKTKEEKDCIEYDLYVAEEDKTHFIFIEEWPDHEALDRHCKTEHFRRLVPLIDKHQYKEGIVTIMEIFK